MTSLEARVTQLLALYGYPPSHVDADSHVVRATFRAHLEEVTVETRYVLGTSDATIASDLIIRAAARGVRVVRLNRN